MSRFNTLYHGDSFEIANELEDSDASVEELRVALVNAARKIASLEDRIARIDRVIADHLRNAV